MLYFGVFMVFIYLMLGLCLIFAPILKYIDKEPKVIFGIFFVVYGIFRLIRIYPKIFHPEKENEQNEEND